jgi:hypothetical protein
MKNPYNAYVTVAPNPSVPNLLFIFIIDPTIMPQDNIDPVP